MEQYTSVGQPVAKTGLVVFGAGGAQMLEANQTTMIPEVIKVFGLSLADWATLIAIGYTIHLWAQLWWRSHIRPFCERRNWLQRLARRREDHR